ncbi:MAG TPA: RNA-binding protein [Bacteroidales bacterium]|nr:RNA-binding protein [Bacteroidales bacterium]HPB24180.1 RNA-binding protein [Bacteroidales bacterium]HPI30916.1 RNA-binding protein [Bacteroidales bacterium]HQN14777.1 RNA-binding protein [Bacteroidales bacterium]HQP14471.1 RNA-binding protein [Bacteroidales bacterium]
MKIYAGNLHYGMTEDELQKIFEEYGQVASAKIITDKYSGRSKGFGFVEMPDDGEAQQAIEDLNGKDVKGRNITVNQSIERKEGEHRNNRRDNFRRNNNYRNNE